MENDVSIILINYHTSGLIIDCLHSVITFLHDITIEVIIVDNDPQFGQKELILEKFPFVKYITMDSNVGFGRANNAGMRQASGRYFLLLNSDTIVRDDVIERFVRRMDKRPDVIACGAMQYDAEDNPMNYYTSFNDFRKTFYILPPGKFSTFLLDLLYPEPRYADPDQHDWLVGAFIFLRREGFDLTQGFDEDFFMYGEDVEWSGRLGKLGKLCYFKDSKFIHLENKNPFRRSRISWINRFSVQMQVSNLVWIRKQYGIFAYLLLIFHYALMIPVVYLWRMVINVKEDGNPFSRLTTQHIYARKSRVLFRYFWKTILLRKGMYKIQPSENIDILTAHGA